MTYLSDEEDHVKYFIDTHDKTKGSFPQGQLTEAEFFASSMRSKKRRRSSASAPMPLT